MTADERAVVVMLRTKLAGHRYVDEGGMRKAIADAIREAEADATLAERRRCAELAHNWAVGAGWVNEAEGRPAWYADGEMVWDALGDEIMKEPK